MSPAALAQARDYRAPDHRRSRRNRHLRCRALRQGRPGLVLRSQPAAARHRHGDDGDAVAERIRTARAGIAGTAGRCRPAQSRRQRRHLRRSRCTARSSSMAWPTRWRCPASTCGCSASPSPSSSAAWGSHWPAQRPSRTREWRPRPPLRWSGRARYSSANRRGRRRKRSLFRAAGPKRAVYNRTDSAMAAPGLTEARHMKILVVDDHSLITDALSVLFLDLDPDRRGPDDAHRGNGPGAAATAS